MMAAILKTIAKFMTLAFDKISPDILSEYNLSRPLERTDKVCHAPFKTLLFVPSGKAMACHYNRGLVLGQYPKNSIKEIWFGEKISKLRNFINHKDLSYGCQNCKSDLNNKQFHLAGCWRHDYLGEPDNNYPILIDLQIDNTCNLECVMCSGEYSSLIRKNREKKLPHFNPYDKNFVKQLEEFIPHLHGINLTGGEPFLVNVYYDILDRIISLNPKIEIYIHSNATVLNNKVKKYMEKLNFNFTLSIDSIVKPTYEKIRINAKHEKVMRNIQYFHQYSIEKGLSFHIKCCLMKNNILELPDFLSFFNNQNISVQLKPVLFPSSLSLRTLPKDELRIIIDGLKKVQLKNNTHFQKLNCSRFNEVLSQLNIWGEESLENQGSIDAEEETMVSSLFQKIDALIEEDHTLSVYEKNIKVKHCKDIGTKMLHSVQDSLKRKDALNRFLQMPIEFIVAEMTRGDIEMLNARFHQEI